MPEAFEMTVDVALADIDGLGHVNNIVYLRWVQEVAVAHWRTIAPPEAQSALTWIILRHEIDYRHAAYLGDPILLRTWVGGATRLKFERHTEILRAADRTLLAKALTLWCPIDTRTGRPTPVSPEVRALFSLSPAGA